MYLEKSKYCRRIFIGDIHGSVKTLQKLLKKIAPQKCDALIFLGDYINKGVDSLGVIELLSNLKKVLPNVFFIRGNHENTLLKLSRLNDKVTIFYYVRKHNSSDLIDIFGNFKTQVLEFISQTVFYIEFEDAFAVHAGFNFSSHDFLKDTNAMIDIRNWTTMNPPTTKRIIYGHQPVKFREIKLAIKRRSQFIPLDNGCVYKFASFNNYKDFGRLCALDLDNFYLYYQHNIDNKKVDKY